MKGKAYRGCKANKEEHKTKYSQSSYRAARCVGPRCSSRICERCRGCNTINEEERKKIFDNFWDNLDWTQKQLYVCSLTNVRPKARNTSKNDKSKRNNTFEYYLEVNNENIRVCKVMFLNTLALRQQSVQRWKLKAIGIANRATDSQEKLTQKRKQRIAKEFLDFLPKLPSHYCRQSSSKIYLQPDIEDACALYDLFKQYLIDQNQPIISRTTLTRELKKQNISFHRPKKDRCDVCVGFETSNVSQEQFDEHNRMKQSAREEKNHDKQDGNWHHAVYTVDVQAVLICPKLFASAHYYKTKLACHNYTFYNLKSKDVTCFFWDETEGDLNSSTFASCLWKFLSDEVDKHALTKITLYSDGCGYQNRNAVVSNTLLEFAITTGIEIEQKFLVKGHTQMEVDSAHSTIERKIKNRCINHPSQYADAMRECRPNQPFKVETLEHGFFKDFSGIKYLASIRPGKTKGDPQVHDLRALRYLGTKTEPKVQFKVDFASDYQNLPQRMRLPSQQFEIVGLHKCRIKIKKTKFDHLQQLKSVLPPIYHAFYDNLPH